MVECKKGEKLNPKNNTCEEDFEGRIERVMKEEFKRLKYPPNIDLLICMRLLFLNAQGV